MCVSVGVTESVPDWFKQLSRRGAHPGRMSVSEGGGLDKLKLGMYGVVRR